MSICLSALPLRQKQHVLKCVIIQWNKHATCRINTKKHNKWLNWWQHTLRGGGGVRTETYEPQKNTHWLKGILKSMGPDFLPFYKDEKLISTVSPHIKTRFCYSHDPTTASNNSQQPTFSLQLFWRNLKNNSQFWLSNT